MNCLLCGKELIEFDNTYRICPTEVSDPQVIAICGVGTRTHYFLLRNSKQYYAYVGKYAIENNLLTSTNQNDHFIYVLDKNSRYQLLTSISDFNFSNMTEEQIIKKLDLIRIFS